MENIDKINLALNLDTSNSSLNLLKENVLNLSDNILNLGNIELKNWSLYDIEKIYEELELKCWASWLSASKDSLEGRCKTFEKGQFLLLNDKEFLASLSTNLIHWDGNPDSLKSWDDVAGNPTTFENTFDKNGNSIVLMSMNVNPNYRGLGLPNLLIEQVNKLALDIGLDYIIGSFRPSLYGNYKLENPDINFYDYIKLKSKTGELIDPWLKVLTRNGMKMLKVDENAMTVEISAEEFDGLDKTSWVFDGKKYECGEVGSWEKHKENSYVYKESNVWGVLNFNKGQGIINTL